MRFIRVGRKFHGSLVTDGQNIGYTTRVILIVIHQFVQFRINNRKRNQHGHGSTVWFQFCIFAILTGLVGSSGIFFNAIGREHTLTRFSNKSVFELQLFDDTEIQTATDVQIKFVVVLLWGTSQVHRHIVASRNFNQVQTYATACLSRRNGVSGNKFTVVVGADSEQLNHTQREQSTAFAGYHADSRFSTGSISMLHVLHTEQRLLGNTNSHSGSEGCKIV